MPLNKETKPNPNTRQLLNQLWSMMVLMLLISNFSYIKNLPNLKNKKRIFSTSADTTKLSFSC